MISILVGTDQIQKSARIKSLAGDGERTLLSGADVSLQILQTFAGSTSLFGESPIVVIENMITESQIVLGKEDLVVLSESLTLFILREDKLLKANETKYKNYATIERFEEKKAKTVPTTNVFAIADAFAQHDKVTTWVLYREAVERGVSPEEISGMLFWKVKQMLLSPRATFDVESLKHISSQLVDLYHNAHQGACDFSIGLEQLILSSLSK
jgi:hypothetical protein